MLRLKKQKKKRFEKLSFYFLSLLSPRITREKQIITFDKNKSIKITSFERKKKIKLNWFFFILYFFIFFFLFLLQGFKVEFRGPSRFSLGLQGWVQCLAFLPRSLERRRPFQKLPWQDLAGS